MFVRYSLAVIFIILFSFSNLSAHNHTIKGVAISKNGDEKPIPGATVRLGNTTIGTIANKNGEFVLRGVPDGEFELIISSIGYETYSLPIVLEHSEGDEHDIVVELVETNLSIPNLVVTATRSEKIYEDTPVKVSVLSSKIFESTASNNLRDGLSFQPGLRIESNCQNCGTSEVKMNGLGGQYSQILIDSRPVFSSLNAVYGLEQIPTNMIDRIEIVRGGGSALYGGSAIAGVINIITRDPHLNTFEASVNQSFTNNEKSDNTFNLNASVVNDKQDMGVFLFGMNRNREAWDATGDGISDIPELKVTTFGARAYYKPNYKSRLGFQYHIVSDNRRGGNRFDQPYHLADLTEAVNHITNSGQLTYESFIGTYSKFSSYVSFQNTDRDNYYGVYQDPNGYGITNNSTGIIGSQFSRIFPDLLGSEHILTMGYEFKYDEMEDNLTGYNLKLNQTTREHGFFIQDDFKLLDNMNIVLGSRFDKHNFLNDFVVSPRASLLYKPLKNLSLRGSISTGFRAPAAFDEDLHINLVAGELQVVRMSDNLKSENSRNFNLSADLSFYIGELPVAASAEFFSTRLSDVFVLEYTGIVDDGYVLLERRNAQGAEIDGVTFELQTNMRNNFDFAGGFSMQRSSHDEEYIWFEEGEEIRSTDKFLKSPEWYGYFSVMKYFGERFTLDLSGVLTGPMFLPHFAGGIAPDGSVNTENRLKETPAFFEMNLKASYFLSFYPDIEISLGVQNVFNSFQNDKDSGLERDPYYIYGPVRPRTAFFGVKTTL